MLSLSYSSYFNFFVRFNHLEFRDAVILRSGSMDSMKSRLKLNTHTERVVLLYTNGVPIVRQKL